VNGIAELGKKGRMRTLHRRFGIVAVLFVAAAGCGSGDSSTSSTSTSSVTTVPTTTSVPTSKVSTTVAGAIVQNVTDGAVCSPDGARGVTSAGRAMVCGAGAAGNTQTIWRPA
jgi:hypothetical protein